MSPTPAYTGELTISFPRSRGDEPLDTPLENETLMFSPLTRG